MIKIKVAIRLGFFIIVIWIIDTDRENVWLFINLDRYLTSAIISGA